MSPVKQPSTVLMGRMFRRASRDVLTADVDGLRPSRLRLLGEVPSQGCRITELAELLGMTKQACGQIVADLVDSAHLVTSVPADDRRSRVVRLTPKGRRAVARSLRHLAAVDERWAAQVGQERFATFLDVLTELTSGSSGAVPPDGPAAPRNGVAGDARPH